MASQEDHVKMFRSFIRANGNSENVCNLYWKRVRTFLAKHPEAMELDKDALKSLVDDYISAIPITSGIEVTATAVRYYWTMRFGERWCKRFDPKDYPTSEAIEKECSEFAVYLQSLGYLSARTVHDRTNKVKRFLYVMFDSGFDRGKVCLASVMAYLAEGMPGMSASTRRGFCTEVRSYARFLASRGCVETAGPISRMRLTGPAIADKLPDCIADCDYAAMVASIDTSSARGKRDLAMLMLMGNLGLRRSDAALLDVGDVDWANGVLHVRNSKSQSDRSIPIDAVTGKALEDYALKGRPEACGRALFLPCGKEAKGERMTFDQVEGAMKLVSQKAGVAFRGTHSLRRAVASGMVNGGTPIKFVADILGHESVATTMVYLRIDAERLRLAASPWPAGVAS